MRRTSSSRCHPKPLLPRSTIKIWRAAADTAPRSRTGNKRTGDGAHLRKRDRGSRAEFREEVATGLEGERGRTENAAAQDMPLNHPPVQRQRARERHRARGEATREVIRPVDVHILRIRLPEIREARRSGPRGRSGCGIGSPSSGSACADGSGGKPDWERKGFSRALLTLFVLSHDSLYIVEACASHEAPRCCDHPPRTPSTSVNFPRRMSNTIFIVAYGLVVGRYHQI